MVAAMSNHGFLQTPTAYSMRASAAPTPERHSPACSGQIADHDGIESPGPMPMTKTVLIVEDNELNMKLFHDLLDAHGYATLQTRNGVEALDLAREHRPDLILMDIQLPEVSGLEVTKWLKEDDQLREIPVVAVTAFAMKGDEERIREGGCEAYISKPISVMMFLDTVKQFIGEAR
jgi:two-component system cell cycle response regulator DivK